MQRGQHQVPGERSLHGDLRGLQVADLADHDDVRVLPEDRPQGYGEGHVDARVDLDLADPRQVVLHRVLDGEDVAGAGVEPRQAGVQGDRLARAGGPGDQHDAVRLADQVVQRRQHAGSHAQGLQPQASGLLVQQAHHHPFAVAGGHGGDANVDRPPGYPQGDAAVLGQAFLGDIQLRHDLDPRHQRRVQRLARRDHVAQGAVDPVAHLRMGLEGLDVDVAGLIARGLGQQRVDHADHWRAILGVEQVGNLGDIVHQAVEVDLALRRADHRRGAAGIGVGAGQQGVELVVADALQAGQLMPLAHLADRPAGRPRADQQGRAMLARPQQGALRLGPGVGQQAHSGAASPSGTARSGRGLGRKS